MDHSRPGFGRQGGDRLKVSPMKCFKTETHSVDTSLHHQKHSASAESPGRYVKTEFGYREQSPEAMETSRTGLGDRDRSSDGSANTNIHSRKRTYESVPPPDVGYSIKLEGDEEEDPMEPHTKYIKTNSDARPAEASSVVGRMMV